jgi:hypothetical protein
LGSGEAKAAALFVGRTPPSSAELNLDALSASASAGMNRSAGRRSIRSSSAISRSSSTMPCLRRSFVAPFERRYSRRCWGVRIFDRYQGKCVPDGKISLSLLFTFQAPNRTLTDAPCGAASISCCTALVREHGAAQR